jgi:hypothetical protein
MLTDEPLRHSLAESGWEKVREKYDLPALSAASERLWASLGAPGA